MSREEVRKYLIETHDALAARLSAGYAVNPEAVRLSFEAVQLLDADSLALQELDDLRAFAESLRGGCVWSKELDYDNHAHWWCSGCEEPFSASYDTDCFRYCPSCGRAIEMFL